MKANPNKRHLITSESKDLLLTKLQIVKVEDD